MDRNGNVDQLATAMKAVTLQEKADTKKRKAEEDLANPPAAKRQKTGPGGARKGAGRKALTDEEKKKNAQRYRDMCLTDFKLPLRALHLMSVEYLEELYGEYCTYGKCVFERCPESDKLHAHLYLQFNTQQRWSKLKKRFPHQHMEPRMGTRRQAVHYLDPTYICRDKSKFYYNKEKSEYTTLCGPWEFGVFRDQGTRADLKEIRQFIFRCETWQQFMVSPYGCNPNVIRNLKWAKECFHARPHKNLSKEVVLNCFQKVVCNFTKKIKLHNLKRPAGMGREVLVVIDELGCHGKSVVCTWMMDMWNAAQVVGSIRDAVSGYNYEPIVFFDVARAQGRDNADGKTWFPTTLVELFSTGRLSNTKYVVHTKRGIAPVPIIFTNSTTVPWNDLTLDRWQVLRINRDHSLDYCTPRVLGHTVPGAEPHVVLVRQRTLLTPAEGLTCYTAPADATLPANELDDLKADVDMEF